MLTIVKVDRCVYAKMQRTKSPSKQPTNQLAGKKKIGGNSAHLFDSPVPSATEAPTRAFHLSGPWRIHLALSDQSERSNQWTATPGAQHLLRVAINLHNSEHFKMVSTSTPRSRISIATRHFAACQRTPTRQQMSLAIILQNHALI